MATIRKSVLRALRDDQSSAGVLVKLDMPAEAAREVVERLVESAIEDGDPLATLAALSTVQTARGPAVVLANVEPDSFRAALRRLVELLDRAGHPDAVLSAMPTVAPFYPHWDELAYVKAFFALRGRIPPRPTPGKPDPSWRPWFGSDEDLVSAVDHLVTWALNLPEAKASVAVRTGDRFYTPYPLDGVRDVVRREFADGARPADVAVVAQNRAGWFRSAEILTAWGVASAAEGLERQGQDALPWQQTVDHLTELLTSAGGWCPYAHLVRGHSAGGLSAIDPEHGDRRSMSQELRDVFTFAPLLARGRLPDGFGVMRFDPHRIPVPALGSRWTTRPTSADTVLVAHDDPARWFAAPEVDRDTLQETREELADRIIPRGEEINRWLFKQSRAK